MQAHILKSKQRVDVFKEYKIEQHIERESSPDSIDKLEL